MTSPLPEVLEERTAGRNRRAWIVLAILCAIGAAAAIRRFVALGTVSTGAPAALLALDEHFRSKAGAILLHVAPSLLFVLLAPLQFVSSLRRRRPRLHRWTGRAVMSLGGVLGISALWLSVHPVGGVVEGSATISFGCLFLFSLARA